MNDQKMRVLVTGHDGYIGQVLVPMFRSKGHDVIGVDSNLFHDCTFGEQPDPPESVVTDVRDLDREVFDGVDAVIHLAAISNDPLGDLNPDCTYDINHRATVKVAEMAKSAGVTRFLYSSSCSLYGAQGDAPIDESADFNPLTPYGESKVLSERDLSAMADDDFSPTYLRNSTAYGVSPRLRGDLVVNNLTGFAVTTGKVFLKSDGTSWRPLVHVADISAAFLALMEAPRDLVHDRPFNIGTTTENYQIRDVARIVEEVVPDSRITLSDEAFNDPRNYRVTCDRIAREIPGFKPQWTVRRGVEELYRAFTKHDLTLEQLEGDRFMRVKHVNRLLDAEQLDSDLRWTMGAR